MGFYMDKVFIGFDTRMPQAFEVCAASMREKSSRPLNINPLLLPHLVGSGKYYRPTHRQENGGMFDVISDAPMSTEFAISRFLVPYLSRYTGWSLFCDSDFLWFSDVQRLFNAADSRYAVMCVKHKYEPQNGVKMDGQAQTSYARKNWSSLILFNNSHPANAFLTVANVNKYAGRDLHRFCWLSDDQIGAIDESWNWLEGHSSEEIAPDAIHYTRGTPDMIGYEQVIHADTWRGYLKKSCIQAV